MSPLSSLPRPAALFSRLLNALLNREDWARQRLSRHSGKTVHFKAGKQLVRLTINASGTTQPSDPAIVPDVTLSMAAGRWQDLPALLREGGVDDLTEVLHIEGDAALAQTVAELARNLRWDVEHELAGHIGDIAARRVLRTLPALSWATRRSGWRLARNATEYLAHESALMANQPALALHAENLARLEKRLQALESRLNHLDKGPAEPSDV
ncbi:MAG TPA: SCP2 sterol-binding domain-containing protein [Burkholderiaceae bacterium]|nr:SCP2 sterol-binding domain-containing protein [Burkholderiaceae bacterium]